MMYNRNNFNNQHPNNQTTVNNHQFNINNQSGTDIFANNPKLKNIDPLKLKIILEIQKNSKNKSIEELLPEIMKINQELNRRNMSFTKQETSLLLDAIEESLSPEDKKRFNMLKGFIN